jgi:hypothetical protein
MTLGRIATGSRARFLCPVCLAAFAGLVASIAGAQTASQFAAWDALMLSPIGALSPRISAAIDTTPANAFALRFGRWRYNRDDAPHEAYALTWSRALGSRARGSVTAGYLFLRCANCGAWEVAGLDVASSLWQSEVHPFMGHLAHASFGTRFTVGGGLLRGDPASVARSAALEAPIDFRMRYRPSHEVRASLTPGLGYGSMWAHAAGSDGGALPMLGLTVALDMTSLVGMELGAHRVFIAGGPLELGFSLVWGIR